MLRLKNNLKRQRIKWMEDKRQAMKTRALSYNQHARARRTSSSLTADDLKNHSFAYKAKRGKVKKKLMRQKCVCYFGE